MKRKELLAICEELIKSFDPAKTTVDAHATEELRGLSSTADQHFLQQVLYGSYRYRELLRPMLTIFLDSHSSQVSRTDYTKFLIIGYLAMFRLEELGTTTFAGLTLALQPTSMHTFLSYIFNPDELRGAMQAQWSTVLDAEYVETQIVDKMLSFKPAIDKLLTQLHAKAFGRASSTRNSSLSGPDSEDSDTLGKPLTVPVMPNITQPKPRRAQEPIRIPREVKANPVPASLNRLSLADLQAQQEARKERIKAEVASKYDASDEFHLATAARRSNLEAVREEVEREREAALQFDFKAKPVPHASTSAATAANTTEVKLTTAAILREDALHKRKKDREAALIRDYESGLRDPLEFYRWQTNMQQQDEANWRHEVETRRLEMVQAQYDAIEAAKQAKLENREVALEMKERARDRAAEREQEENELLAKYRNLTEEVKRVRDTAPREAEAQVREENARQRDALQEFLAAERERKAQEDAKEQAAREDLIRQIRALDRVHREHVAVFDPTETAQLGLLQEMSLAELRERLRVRHEEQKRWEESRRETILTDKQEKNADLLEKATSAARRRRTTASANAAARSKKKALAAAREMEEQALRRKNNLELAEKLKRQREERTQQTENLRLEAEEMATRRRFLGAAKNMLEENHFDQLKCGFEREAKNRQETHQVESITMENVRVQEKRMNAEFRERQKLAKQDEEQVRAQLYSRAKEDARQRDRAEDETLRALVRHEQQRFAHARDTLQARNMYATNQTQSMTAHARLLSTTRTKMQSKTLAKSPSHNQEQEPQVAM
ncbi:Cilia- and flagella-associated protein 99 [Phytophthora citrophthora]|uniref:Cilia- and flagella-associated protein 99 n=1 Tax=Phytophthora citrophthora TaxID=4793 RepID=A0AAD9LSA6_9STRA|nr:Cilia- and flagella-associated protein 99 [Phytophthora citrophthora]